jgi:plastocyanin
MKKSNFIWVVLLVALMLSVVGCGDKDDDKEPVPSETVSVEGEEKVEEPSVVDDVGIQEQDSDVTSELLEEESDGEDVLDDEVSDVEDSDDLDDGADSERNETGLTAQNYRVVSLKDLKAYPDEMNIKVGTTVEWRNVNDNLLHIIGWKGQKQMGVTPEPILAGESWSYTFDEPGRIAWFSTARPTVQGIINVEE